MWKDSKSDLESEVDVSLLMLCGKIEEKDNMFLFSARMVLYCSLEPVHFR